MVIILLVFLFFWWCFADLLLNSLLVASFLVVKREQVLCFDHVRVRWVIGILKITLFVWRACWLLSDGCVGWLWCVGWLIVRWIGWLHILSWKTSP